MVLGFKNIHLGMRVISIVGGLVVQTQCSVESSASSQEVYLILSGGDETPRLFAPTFPSEPTGRIDSMESIDLWGEHHRIDIQPSISPEKDDDNDEESLLRVSKHGWNSYRATCLALTCTGILLSAVVFILYREGFLT